MNCCEKHKESNCYPCAIEACRNVIQWLKAEFDAAVAHHENKNTGGQKVSFHGDFASVGPSVVGRMRWWSKYHMAEALSSTSAADYTARVRRDALEEAAKVADGTALYCEQDSEIAPDEGRRLLKDRAFWALAIAAAIRALAKPEGGGK